MQIVQASYDSVMSSYDFTIVCRETEIVAAPSSYDVVKRYTYGVLPVVSELAPNNMAFDTRSECFGARCQCDFGATS